MPLTQFPPNLSAASFFLAGADRGGSVVMRVQTYELNNVLLTKIIINIIIYNLDFTVLQMSYIGLQPHYNV